ncbi:MAG: aminotransferase class V-fold PLP-dependent enzyme [Corallococcus sp.]|nr:aminotransferase class V-fold PLP-dependent enzyme [Corallococcus sp.]
MIYLDNAATTRYKPQEVIDAVLRAVTELPFNPNRGGCSESAVLEEKIYDARMAFSAFAGGSNCHTVFSQNCTTALNLAIIGLAKRGGHVITTSTEHNSVLRPLAHLRRSNLIDVTVINPDDKGNIRATDVINALKNETYMVVMSRVSNVTGKMQDVNTIGNAVKQAKSDVLFVCDQAQAVGYAMTDMENDKIDAVAYPAHKGLHGLQGCGILTFNNRATPRPTVYGGTGTESDKLLQPSTVPDGLEAGTLNCPAILAAYAALTWWIKDAKNHIEKVRKLQQRLQNGLAQIPNVTLYSQPNDSGIAAFNVANYDSDIVADALSKQYDIATRAGLHCAPLMHKYLGTTNQGLVRASVAVDVTESQCDEFLNAVNSLASQHSISA